MPSGGESTEWRNMDGMSTPEPTGTQPEAVESTPKTEGSDEEEKNDFVNDNGSCHSRSQSHPSPLYHFLRLSPRQKAISEDKASLYWNAAKDNDRMEQKFCAAYDSYSKYLLASITCTMAHCKESGCVLDILIRA